MSNENKQQSSGNQSPNISTESGDVSITYATNREAMLKAIPDYFDQLLHLLPGPRRFLAGGGSDQDPIFSRGIMFLFVSCVFSFLLRLPLVGAANIQWGVVASSMVFSLFTGLTLSVTAYLACRLVGGKGALKSHVGAFAYIAGVITVFHTLISLAAQLVILAMIPDSFPLYQEYMYHFFSSNLAALQCERFASLEQGSVLLVSMGIFLGGLLCLFGWTLVAWRALGDLNGFSAAKVSLSLVLFLFMGFFVSQGFGALQGQLVRDAGYESAETCPGGQGLPSGAG